MLDELQRKAQQAGDVYAASDIWQLQSLCERIEIDAFKPVSEADITSPTDKRINQFKGIVDDLVARLVASGIVSIAKYRATPGPDYYKRYMSVGNYFNWCIEYNEQYKKQHAPTAIWLTNTVKPQLSSIVNKLAPVYFLQDKQILIPLEIPLHVEREAVINSLFEQVTDVSKRLIQ